ncbi:MAG: SH3 domain-containing protein [Bdellovibrionaceae bacterium]|nr:SH3 domain-containing protein [Pseudobdellovibrionaceae bacterium]
MFGSFASRRFGTLLLLATLCGLTAAEAQQKKATRRAPAQASPAAAAPAPAKAAAGSQKGIITVAEASIFNQPNFDGQVIGMAGEGQVFDISTGTRDSFYKIRLRPGFTGWISEAEIRPINSGQAQKIETQRKKTVQAQAKKAAEKRPKAKPMDQRRFRGLALESMNFTEKTMGKTRRSNVLLYGLKVSGPNTLFEGDIETDTEILFHSGAPGYYKDATGNAAGGFMLMGNFLFQTTIPRSENLMAFYGFGPSFRLSHFEVSLNNDPGPGGKRSYALDDMTVGAVFNLGAVMSFGSYAARLEGRYYWETQQYMSFGLAFQKEF